MESFHSVSKASQYASAASPGVNLERGAYRMRAPSIRPLPSLNLQDSSRTTTQRRPQQQRANVNLTFLLLLLMVACMTSFALAYYLYTTRWDLRTFPGAYALSNAPREATVHDQGFAVDPTRRYLSYLPHSGFHNQRIALENAFILAHVLNRTLLIPPIRLGDKPIRYVEYDTLSQYHELSGREGLQHCSRIPPHVSRPLECLHYSQSSYLPWTWLVDFSTLQPQISHLHTLSMSPSWIRNHLNLNSADIHTLKDGTPYHYRFVDDVGLASRQTDKYLEDITISQLLSVDQSLLQLGTLFGTSRIVLNHSDNLSFRQSVRQAMAFRNQDLLKVADTISRSLGNHFFAVHLRLGDGAFQSQNDLTVNKIWLNLVHRVIGLAFPAVCDLASQSGANVSGICNADGAEGRGFSYTPRTLFTLPENLPRTNMPCRGVKHQDPKLKPLNLPLFIATDLSSPETHPLLSVFRRTFPCIYFLGDFPSELKPLELLRSPYDGVYLYPFILPFVDALVAGKALSVVGTDKSTFSKFVKEILWLPPEARTQG